MNMEFDIFIVCWFAYCFHKPQQTSTSHGFLFLYAASVGEVFAYCDKVPGFTIFLKNVVCKWLNLWLLFLTCRVYFGRFMMIWFSCFLLIPFSLVCEDTPVLHHVLVSFIIDYVLLLLFRQDLPLVFIIPHFPNNIYISFTGRVVILNGIKG